MKQPQPSTHPLESLLKQHCPNGVEFKELGELFTIKNGYTPSKAKAEFWEGGTIPWFRMEDIQANGRILKDSIQHITPQAVKGELFPANSIIISTTATIGEHALVIVDYLSNQRFTCLIPQVNCCDKLSMRFMFYYGFILGEWCRNNVNKSAFPSVKMEQFKKVKIPIPPLEIQQKIVDILDAFTELQAELQAELHARRKQYEYYRNKLLSFEELEKRANAIGGGLKIVTLGEIGTFTRGNGLTKSDFVEVGVPCIHYGQIHTHYHNYTHSTTSFVSEEKARKLKKAKCGDLVIAGVSEDKDLSLIHI